MRKSGHTTKSASVAVATVTVTVIVEEPSNVVENAAFARA
jgi:hypothetical protein